MASQPDRTIQEFDMTIRLHRGDLPDLSRYGREVAIDTETMGLDPRRDRLCASTAPSSPRRYHADAATRGVSAVRLASALEACIGAARAARRATTASSALRITGREL